MRKYMQDAAPLILDCRPFVNDRQRKSFSGSVVKEARGKIVYVIYSYTTPIAFFIGRPRLGPDKLEWVGAWYMTRQRYSETTTQQQHGLRLILRGKTVLDLGTADFNELLADASK